MLFSAGNGLLVVTTCVIGVAIYFVFRLVSHRLFFRNLPGPPHSLLWGHLQILGTYTQKLPPGAYVHHPLAQIKQDYALPDIFYLDLFPFAPNMVFLSSPDAVAFPTTVNNYQMPDIVGDSFVGNVGTSFIEATNGALWKRLFQQLAPGLTPTATKSYYQNIVQHAKELHQYMKQIAESDKKVDIQYELGRYPFKVLCTVFFGRDVGAMAYENVTRMLELMAEQNTPGALMNPLRKRQWTKDMDKSRGILENWIEEQVRARFQTLRSQSGAKIQETTPIILDRMLMSQMENASGLDDNEMKIIIENAKGLIAAGYGTTTDTSTYMLMLLSTHPEALRKLREEHAKVFGTNFDRAVKLLQEDPGLISSLEYTTAIIQETLRLFPIGMLVRKPPTGSTHFEYKGTKYPLLKDHMFAIMSHTVQTDPTIWENPVSFEPERFLNSSLVLNRNAYRPFERGVRSCIGQTLAMEEMKIALVMLAQWFDFELTDHEPAQKARFPTTEMETKLGKHFFQQRVFTASPTGPVLMNVRLASKQSSK